MKKYFLHNGIESSGPFDLEELKNKKISKNTPVWFDGMEKWSTAGEIDELKSLFITIPPPISNFSPPKHSSKLEKNNSTRKFIGLPKKTFFIVIGTLIIIVGISVLKVLNENRSRELALKNHKTEIENHKYELQQKELEEQKRIQLEAEKAAAERVLIAQKEAQKSNLLAIQQKISENQNSLKETERKLLNASSFKLLRTQAEKTEQINELQKEVDSFNRVIDQLKKESNRIQLELEKMQ